MQQFCVFYKVKSACKSVLGGICVNLCTQIAIIIIIIIIIIMLLLLLLLLYSCLQFDIAVIILPF